MLATGTDVAVVIIDVLVDGALFSIWYPKPPAIIATITTAMIASRVVLFCSGFFVGSFDM